MISEYIEIPEGVEVKIEDGSLHVKGPKGEVSKEFRHPLVSIRLEDKKIAILSEIERRKIKAIVGTWKALAKNMILGVTKGWRGELKLVYSHFPVKLKVEGNMLVIENFLGERSSRHVSVPDDIKVEIKQSMIYVSGADKEKVGMVCGRIEQTAKVQGFDRRVFQDGIYITKKPYLMEE